MVKRKLDFEYRHEDGLIDWGDGSYPRHAIIMQLKQGGFLRLQVYVIRPFAFQDETLGLGLAFPRQAVDYRNCAAND